MSPYELRAHDTPSKDEARNQRTGRPHGVSSNELQLFSRAIHSAAVWQVTLRHAWLDPSVKTEHFAQKVSASLKNTAMLCV